MNKFLYNNELFVTTFYIFLLISVYLFEITIVRNHLISQKEEYIDFHILIGTLIFINCLISLYLLFTTNTSTKGMVLPTKPLSGWFYCHECQANSPPRSFHCHKCRGCILRRDHHCVFTSCCVGHTNYKYFMSLLFYTSVGISYATMLHYEYVYYHLNSGTGIASILCQIVPVMAFIFGYISLWTALLNLLVFICYVGWLFSVGLFIYHFRLLMINQTTYERTKNIQIYNLKSWHLNLIETLGNHWILNVFVCPLIPSKLPNNGLKFPTLDNHKHSQ